MLEDHIQMNLYPYQYRIFGLKVASQIQLSRLNELSFRVADVVIKLDKVNICIPSGVVVDEFEQISSEDYLLNIPDTAKYYVKKGKIVIIEKNCDTPSLLQYYLLGTVFDNILQYRNCLVLHGSAVLVDDKAVIFNGHSGSGKSTLAAAFMKKGYPLLTDDVVVLSPNADGGFSLIPGPPKIKLWQLSIDKLSMPINKARKIARTLDKYEIPVTALNQKSNIEISAFYELNKHELNDIQVKPIQGIDKLSLLLTHTFGYSMLKPMGKLAIYLKACASISKQVQMFKVYRPESVFAIGELVAKIKNNTSS
jgi:hypothetical protein